MYMMHTDHSHPTSPVFLLSLQISFSCSCLFTLLSNPLSLTKDGRVTMDLELCGVNSGHTTKDNESSSPRIHQYPIL